MDSDLADAVESLKAVFAKRKLPCSLGKAPVPLVEGLVASFECCNWMSSPISRVMQAMIRGSRASFRKAG